MAVDDTDHAYEPGGYCPRCSYHTDPGTCPECGLAIEARKLRKRPKTWIHRHIRAILLMLVILAAGVWWAVTQPSAAEVVPYLPTFCLLELQVSQNQLAAPACNELARRYVGGKLGPAQVEQFMKQMAVVEWVTDRECEFSWVFTDFLHSAAAKGDWSFRRDPGAPAGEVFPILLHNLFIMRGFPRNVPLPGLRYEELVHRVKFDGREIRIRTHSNGLITAADGEVDDKLPLPLSPPDCSFCSSGGSVVLTARQGFWSSYLLLVPASGPGIHNVLIETAVIVTDVASDKVIASWPKTHSIHIVFDDRVPLAGSTPAPGQQSVPGRARTDPD